MSNKAVLKIAQNGMVAAIYFLLCLILQPFSTYAVQVRIAEILCLLPFFRRDFLIGTTIGCLLFNLYNVQSTGWQDLVFGTSATLIAEILVAFASPKLLVAALWVVVVNGFVVGFELSWIFEQWGYMLWVNIGLVALGEVIALGVGYLFFMLIKKKRKFFEILQADRHLDFVW